MQILDMLTSQTFAGLSILTSEVNPDNYTALQKKIWNTQLMSVIISYVLLATESEFDISFASSRLDFAACEVTIFGKQ